MRKNVAILLKLFIVFLLFNSLLDSDFGGVIYYGGVFLIGLLFSWLAKKNSEFWFVDSFFSLMFASTGFLKLSGTSLLPSIIGLDKLFHFMGGFVLAWAAYLLVRDKVEKEVLFVVVLSIALSLGVVWEFYEWFSVDPSHLVYEDVMLDLLFDVFGSASFLILRLPLSRKRRSL